MTQLLVVTSPRQMLLLAAAIDHGALPAAPDGRVVVLADTSPVPEVGPGLAGSVALGALVRRGARVVSWNAAISPLHPASFVPRRDEQPVWERFLRARWTLGDGPVDLVLADPAGGPGRALARVLPHARLVMLADRLERWAPARRPLGADLSRRTDVLVAPELLPGLVPHALDEHGTRTAVVPVRRLVDVVAEVVRADASADVGADVGADVARGDVIRGDVAVAPACTGAAAGAAASSRVPAAATALVVLDAPVDLGLPTPSACSSAGGGSGGGAGGGGSRDGSTGDGSTGDGGAGCCSAGCCSSTDGSATDGSSEDGASLVDRLAGLVADEVRAAGLGHARLLVHPASTARQVRVTVRALRGAGIDVSVLDGTVPAEVVVVRDAPRLVVGTASTALVTALALGARDVRAVGTADVLARLASPDHPARTALTVNGALLAPGAEPTAAEVVRLLEAVTYVMHPDRVPHLRPVAVAALGPSADPSADPAAGTAAGTAAAGPPAGPAAVQEARDPDDAVGTTGGRDAHDDGGLSTATPGRRARGAHGRAVVESPLQVVALADALLAGDVGPLATTVRTAPARATYAALAPSVPTLSEPAQSAPAPSATAPFATAPSAPAPSAPTLPHPPSAGRRRPRTRGTLVLGDALSGVAHARLLVPGAARDVVLLDDGTATLVVVDALLGRAPLLRPHAPAPALRRALAAAAAAVLARRAAAGRLTLRTCLPLPDHDAVALARAGVDVVRTTLAHVRALGVVPPVTEDVVVLGSALADDGLVDVAAYDAWADHAVDDALRGGSTVRYLAHRREAPSRLARLAARGAHVETSPWPAELLLRGSRDDGQGATSDARGSTGGSRGTGNGRGIGDGDDARGRGGGGRPGAGGLRRVVTLPTSVLLTVGRTLVAEGVEVDARPVPDDWWTPRASAALRTHLDSPRATFTRATAPATVPTPTQETRTA